MNRREFLWKSTGTVAALSAASFGCQAFPTFPIPVDRPALPRLGRRVPGGAIVATTEARLDLGDGRSVPAWGYDGVAPGPLLMVDRGALFDVDLINRLPDDTTVHWHGLLPPADMDGHPGDAIRPGGSFSYRFPIRQRACLAWYHPHPHHFVAEQVYRGLAGPIVVTDDEEVNLNLPRGDFEHVLVLGDAELDPVGQTLRYRSGPSSDRGSFPLVNGAAYPREEVRRGLHRVRIINAARARVFDLEFPPVPLFDLIGNDGGLIDAPVPLQRVVVGPAERVDLLVDLGAFEPGSLVQLRCRSTQWSLVEFQVTEPGSGSSDRASAVPWTLPPIPSLSSGPVLRNRIFDFQGHDRINGTRYRLDRVDFRVPFGQTERWVFRSSGGTPHPVHVHGAHFQVEERRGGRGRVLPWERGWKDTVLVQRGEEVSVLVRFDAYRGRYLLHCHRLEHEDRGMMLNFEVE